MAKDRCDGCIHGNCIAENRKYLCKCHAGFEGEQCGNVVSKYKLLSWLVLS